MTPFDQKLTTFGIVTSFASRQKVSNKICAAACQWNYMIDGRGFTYAAICALPKVLGKEFSYVADRIITGAASFSSSPKMSIFAFLLGVANRSTKTVISHFVGVISGPSTSDCTRMRWITAIRFSLIQGCFAGVSSAVLTLLFLHGLGITCVFFAVVFRFAFSTSRLTAARIAFIRAKSFFWLLFLTLCTSLSHTVILPKTTLT